ncbi:cytochrome c [Burkholderia sp. RF2-non_BP3]|uniref:Gluconate 2-dehydrogenase cytochrome c subunit (Gadh cytochrome c subunit) (Ga 2-dh cytochrome c subunit) n=1 Tax=Burkholderia multivorans CGD2 TaxID=513052 RepID=B9BNS3_9BURK|nr:gluconate 2-dehydrogenase cytochrome c subunit (gadh cytochrome c subunit) (ga 2-dh cytochrome c subunit) [Burkholderia multivorans CGD2]EEE13612.1 gluconate 2-dehydrogenase cytochrome c subunit (gadh cytochrome c subunit) (ga 2-dh cytochrome c subunit) [Burkholderia multivorans CGD2M]KUY59292.1 alcohol dehydrogenase [Burkholderia sp. RF2-non_BP3]
MRRAELNTILPAVLRRIAGGAISLLLAVSSSPSSAADPGLVARGEYLAKVGDCIACHSTPNGKPFAGGMPMVTPMGRIFTTNITPDRRTGIGTYSEQDFSRAVREGVAKDGRNLYPAMPYPSYAKISDDDMKAMYAYFMNGVPAVTQVNRNSDIPWPLSMRWPLKIWNVLFLDSSPYRSNPQKTAQWNRGAYLIQGLGHCGACHTPRGIAFQEKAMDESGPTFLSGAVVENWYASSLTADSKRGIGRWSEADIVEFLRTGANRHATAFGSMVDVVNHSTQHLVDDDARAIAAYLKSYPPIGGDAGAAVAALDPTTKIALRTGPVSPGEKTYGTYCLHCHRADGKGSAPWLAPLAGNPNVLEANPVGLINVTLNGSETLVIAGIPAAYPMPRYHAVLEDRQIADVLTYVRGAWGNDAPAVSVDAVAKVRRATAPTR